VRSSILGSPSCGATAARRKNRSSIQPGVSLVRSRSDRGFADEFSRVGRNSLSYVGRRGSRLGCVNPNDGMRQAPQLSFEVGVLGHAASLPSATPQFNSASADRQHWGGLPGGPALEPVKVSEIGLARVCHGTLNYGGASRHLRPGFGPSEGDASGVVGMIRCAVDGAPNSGRV
jgi:hypothetical protein